MTKVTPPKWADRFLQWYCRSDLLEEIQGDSYELFSREEKRSPGKARLQFIWNVIRFLRLKNIRKTTTRYSTVMIKSYFLIGLRNALHNLATTLINVAGLSIGIGVAVTTFIYADFMLHLDNFHADKDRIFQVISRVKENNSSVRAWGDSPLMLGPLLKADHSIIESAVRIEFSGGTVRYKDVVFSESIWFVDPDFLGMFSFPLLEGNTGALTNKNNVVLTKRIAEKYFGKSDPIGQVLSIKFNNGKKEEFTVIVVMDVPENSGMHPQVLLSMEKFDDLKFKDSYDWSYLTDALFVKLKPGHGPREIEGTMSTYISLQNTSSPEWVVVDFGFVPLPVLAQKSEIVSAVTYGAHPSAIISLSVIAIMLLLLACFNYMNVSVATMTTRLKEIGIRKVTGGCKSEIVQQFLMENLVLCTIALALGAGLAYIFFLPGFNSLYPITLPFTFSSGNTAYIFFFALLILVTLISGAYPAVYVASFKPIHILQGREKFDQRSVFSRILLTLQFILAFTTIVGSFVFIDNAIYQKNRSWGYDHDQILVIPVGDKTQFLAIRDKVATNEHVEGLAGSANHVGYQNRYTSFDHLGQRFQTATFRVGFDYLETMNVRLNEGRYFAKDIQSDARESVIINESFATRMGWKKPLNQSFEYDSITRYVVGVVSDFHYEGFYAAIGPVLFTTCPEDDFRYLSLKISKGHLAESEIFTKSAWKETAPDDPYLGFRQEDVFEDFHRDNTANVKLIAFVSAMAVILACLGLFGLVSYNITRRLKEFSIRKVFGANLAEIFKLMNRDYVWILLISFLIGAPSGFFLITEMIQHIYPDPKAANGLPFLTAITLMLVTVAITIGSQLTRVARENPTVTLRSE